jgi:hypothetical protein
MAAIAAAPMWAGNANRPDWLVARPAAGPSARDAHAMAYDSRRGRVVLFAGANEYSREDFSDTWEWDGAAWIERTPATSPPLRFGHAMAYDAARGRVVLFGGYDLLAGLALADTWEWDGNTWVEAAPAATPPGRYGHSMVYDSVRQRVVLFGGAGNDDRLADTWEWDGRTWLERTPAASPPPRDFGACVYDGARGRAVLFGGFDGASPLADTWEWDGESWLERATATHPPARTWLTLAFDDGRGRTVLFGGYDGSTPLGDTWEWDGSTWLETTPAAGPAPRAVGAMVFDRARGRAVLFGGFDGRAPLGDTWEWNGTGWVDKTPTTSPPRRSSHAAAYDDARRKTVLFAGYAGDAFLADTWEWDGSVWARKTPAASPPSRVFHAMAYDRARGRVVLFGGFGQRGPVADTWEWDGSSWVEKTPAASPPRRHSHTMAYDAARERIVLFGGSNGFEMFADTWEWDGSNWVEVMPATSPAARYHHAMAYDAARGRVVLFGGSNGVDELFADTWEWDGNGWVEKTPATSPPARMEHALAYDFGRERAVLFGGYHSSLVTSDTWEWDGNDWTEATPASIPLPRFHHTLTYDGTSGHVLLFGGFNGTYLADTTEYGPIAACVHANRVIAFAPGSGTTSTTAQSALGAPDGTAVALGIGGRVDLGLESAAVNDAGTDLIVHATDAAPFRVEAGMDGDHYALLRDCPGGECPIDLSEAGLAGASYVRITGIAPEIGPEIDAVSVTRAGSIAMTCPASVRIECQAAGSAVVSLPPATVANSCSGIASIVNDHNAGGADASGTYPLGTTVVTFTAADAAGNVASCSTSITVADTTPPVMTVRATPEALWPPNHTMRSVHFTVVAVDACDPNPVTVLQSLSSSDPDDAPGRGDGATVGDVQGADAGAADFDVLLRAERHDRGQGRIYTARYRSTDASDNVATGGGTVAVPHDQRRPPIVSSSGKSLSASRQ